MAVAGGPGLHHLARTTNFTVDVTFGDNRSLQNWSCPKRFANPDVAAQNDQYVAPASRCVAEPVRAGFTSRAGSVGFACPQISGLFDPLTGSGLAAADHRLEGAAFPRDAGQRIAGRPCRA